MRVFLFKIPHILKDYIFLIFGKSRYFQHWLEHLQKVVHLFVQLLIDLPPYWQNLPPLLQLQNPHQKNLKHYLQDSPIY